MNKGFPSLIKKKALHVFYYPPYWFKEHVTSKINVMDFSFCNHVFVFPFLTNNNLFVSFTFLQEHLRPLLYHTHFRDNPFQGKFSLKVTAEWELYSKAILKSIHLILKNLIKKKKKWCNFSLKITKIMFFGNHPWIFTKLTDK